MFISRDESDGHISSLILQRHSDSRRNSRVSVLHGSIAENETKYNSCAREHCHIHRINRQSGRNKNTVFIQRTDVINNFILSRSAYCDILKNNKPFRWLLGAIDDSVTAAWARCRGLLVQGAQKRSRRASADRGEGGVSEYAKISKIQCQQKKGKKPDARWIFGPKTNPYKNTVSLS